MDRRETSAIFGCPSLVNRLSALFLMTVAPALLLPSSPASGKDAALAAPTPRPGETKVEAPAEAEAGSEAASQPKLVCETPTHDFGKIMIGKPLEHVFEISNRGNDTLQIKSVKPTCGCTIAGAYPKSIAPGETGRFPFKLDPNKLHGRFAKTINIETNDPKTPKLVLYLKGELERYVDVTPTGAYFGRQFSKEPLEKTLKITNNTDEKLEVELVPVDEKADFTFELKETDPGKEYELKVTSKPPFEPGTYARAMAQLKTNIKAQETITVNAILANAHSVDVMPMPLRVPTAADSNKIVGTGHQARVSVTNYGKEPLTKFEARIDNDQIKTEIQTLKEGERYYVLLNFPAEFEIPAEGLKLVIETSDANRSTVEVPIQSYTLPTTVQQTPQQRPAMTMVGEAAPKLELKSLGGQTVSSDEFRDHPATVLNFYAANCPACKKQIPQLEQVRSEFEDRGVRFLNVTETMRGKEYTPEQIAELMQQLKTSLEVVIDPGNKVGRTYKVTSFPTMFVVDRGGKVRDVYIGTSGPLKAKTLLEEMIKEEPEPVAVKDSAKDAALAIPTPRPGEAKVEAPVEAEAKTDAATQPRLVCEKPTHDFGAVMIGAALDHTFEISNEGNGTLQIMSVKPTCGCTVAGAYPRSIAPGETGRFPFKLDSRKVHGRFSKAIHIETNDPKNPKLTLYLKGELSRYVDVTPTGAYFGRQYAEEPLEKVIKITNNSDKELEVELEPVAEDAEFQFDLKETVPGKEYELKVMTKPPYTPGTYARAVAQLKTNIESQETISVNAILASAHSVDVLPVILRVPTAANSTKVVGTGHEARVSVTNYAKKLLTRMEARVDNDQIKTEVQTAKEGERYYISLKIPAGFEMPAEGLKLIIETSDANRPKIEVPIQPYTLPTTAQQTPQQRPAMTMVGEAAPKLELKSLGGQTASSDEFKDHPATVLNFYAANCPACKKQIPQLEQVRSEFEDKGVRFLNVTETMRGKEYTPEQIAEVMQQLKTSLEVVIDPDNKVGRTYKVTSFPTMFVVDRGGKVRNVYIGTGGPLQAKELLEEMIKEEPEPAT